MTTVSIVTPTCDRPQAFALCERWMARQTLQPTEWLICDGGIVPAVWPSRPLQRAVKYLPHPGPPGAANLCRNLLAGLEAATGDVLIFCDDDDAIMPAHIATLVAALESSPHALIAGTYPQQYYHVGQRVWRTMPNREHSSLGQTAIRRGAIDILQAIIRQCLAAGQFHIDMLLWKAIARAQWARVEAQTVVGIKGLPGTAGLGIGHRPDGPKWTPDPDLAQLRAWIGADADLYAGFRA